jgi:hypothetical protein
VLHGAAYLTGKMSDYYLVQMMSPLMRAYPAAAKARNNDGLLPIDIVIHRKGGIFSQ